MVNLKTINKKVENLKGKNDKYLFFAYDQGLEHGPNDMTFESNNPQYVIDIANNSEIDAFICQKGIAEKYCQNLSVPLILKCNGKNRLRKNVEAYSPITCSVNYAVNLGAKAIGFTYFDGSAYDYKIEKDFCKIQEEAHNYDLPIITWMYPRGKALKNNMDRETLAYSARIGLELGADMIKVPFNGNIEDLKYMKRSCGKIKLLIQGGEKSKTTEDFLNFIEKTKDLCEGYAIGRNIFKHKKPIQLIKAIRDIQLRNKSVKQAMKNLDD
jgi:class I fructose-bisphosphate aldolase